ncbi:hypothetical protein JYG23_11725 [Sedimentibacter sp. zth1]|uniref:hypothetical protein n=1 Tax=Sedimentibacter sp. zth1 TaxID=2816908 RepID=UPI001A924559|nr:hypothetical protein [Sedimentibacter sp. zth1]QSX05339.1 hypothetical protein JYG23_11725 [Sedimentibacter sp. zth1]
MGNEKKLVALEKKMYCVEDGKLVITSDELAKAIQEENLDLFVDEEFAASNGSALQCCTSQLEPIGDSRTN